MRRQLRAKFSGLGVLIGCLLAYVVPLSPTDAQELLTRDQAYREPFGSVYRPPDVRVTDIRLNEEFVRTQVARGTFTMRNASPELVGDIRYRLEVLAPLPAPEGRDVQEDAAEVFDRFLPPHVFTLIPGAAKTVPFQYYPPAFPAGPYRLRIQLTTSKGRELGWRDADVTLGSGQRPFAYLTPGAIRIPGRESGVISPLAGPTVSPGTELTLTASAENRGTTPLTVIPTLSLHEFDIARRQLATRELPPLTLNPGDKTLVEFPVGAESTPDVYYAILTLRDPQTHAQRSTFSEYRWIVQGESGEIVSARIEELRTRRGGSTFVRLDYGGPADEVTRLRGYLGIELYDQAGILGERSVPNVYLSDLITAGSAQVPLQRNLQGPLGLRVTLQNTTGTVLDTYELRFPLSREEIRAVAKDNPYGFGLSTRDMLLILGILVPFFVLAVVAVRLRRAARYRRFVILSAVLLLGAWLLPAPSDARVSLSSSFPWIRFGAERSVGPSCRYVDGWCELGRYALEVFINDVERLSDGSLQGPFSYKVTKALCKNRVPHRFGKEQFSDAGCADGRCATSFTFVVPSNTVFTDGTFSSGTTTAPLAPVPPSASSTGSGSGIGGRPVTTSGGGRGLASQSLSALSLASPCTPTLLAQGCLDSDNQSVAPTVSWSACPQALGAATVRSTSRQPMFQNSLAETARTVSRLLAQQRDRLRHALPALVSPARALESCDTSYNNNLFHVCYLQGTDPQSETSQVLSQADDAAVPSPVGSWGGFERVWGSGTIADTGKTDAVSGVWRGRVNFESGLYTFYVLSDDGVRLEVEGLGAVLDDLSVHPPLQQSSVALYIPPGPRNVTLRWFDQSQNAQIKFWWEQVPVPVSMKYRVQFYRPSDPDGSPRQDTTTDATSLSVPSELFSSADTELEYRVTAVNAQGASGVPSARRRFSVGAPVQVTLDSPLTAVAPEVLVPFQWRYRALDIQRQRVSKGLVTLLRNLGTPTDDIVITGAPISSNPAETVYRAEWPEGFAEQQEINITTDQSVDACAAAPLAATVFVAGYAPPASPSPSPTPTPTPTPPGTSLLGPATPTPTPLPSGPLYREVAL